jgi:hypothetical protein
MRIKRKKEDKKYVISKDNPANLSWSEILKRYNGGSNETIFGKIEVKNGH